MTKNEQLDFLISELSPATVIPPETERKWQLFRALVNVREPDSISDGFLAMQDKLLQSLIAERGITDIDDLRPVRDSLYLWRGDITALKIGAIVNAANNGMLGCFIPHHDCIDNAIHTFSGVQLRIECAAIMEKQGHLEPTGQAKITSAYNLPSNNILHTVGPIVDMEVTSQHRRLLASCYRSCLAMADENHITSIAFCCISTGEFRFPNDEAARIAIDTVTDQQKSCVYVNKVIFNVFKDKDAHIYRGILSENKASG